MCVDDFRLGRGGGLQNCCATLKLVLRPFSWKVGEEEGEIIMSITGVRVVTVP